MGVYLVMIFPFISDGGKLDSLGDHLLFILEILVI